MIFGTCSVPSFCFPKVADVGYVPVNAALLAKMQIRIEKRGNEEADYVSGRLFHALKVQDPRSQDPR